MKTLYGKRTCHKIEVSVMDKLQRVMDDLNRLDEEELQKYHECKLIYPMGHLRVLSLDKSLYELNVPHEA